MSSIDDRVRLRVTVIGLVILSMLGVLLTRLWFLQILAGDTFARASDRNHVRLVVEEAPRGRILDRNGVVLVKNRTALAVGIRREDFPKKPATARALKGRLARLLGISVAAIDKALADKRTSPYKAAVIKEDVSEDAVFTIRERQEEFPGVETVMLPVRWYPRGSIAAHVIGYVGEVNERELARHPDKYRLGDSIGRTGIEAKYDDALRGRSGLVKLEVDAFGRVLRTLGDDPPVPGDDVQLTLDAKAQAVAERALADGIRSARAKVFKGDGRYFEAPAGAAVVLDARTGEVIAMASNPTFDLSRFVGGVGKDYYAALTDPKSNDPLYNRAIQAAYPPGSTFKPIIATAALATRAASPGGRYPCPTEFKFGDRVFRNWKSGGGAISLAQSLVESCDTVYYGLAKGWWLREYAAERSERRPYEIMPDWARRFGLGSPTGIDLANETGGRVPDRAYKYDVWKRNEKQWCAAYDRTQDPLFEDLCQRGYKWRGGDAVNMSIGQGDVQATPLQIAVAYAALANGGKILTPHVAMQVRKPDKTLIRSFVAQSRAKLSASPAVLRYVQNALRAVSVKGTARFPYRGWPLSSIPMAAKTGSADSGPRSQPLSWFASYGPMFDGHQYVAVAVVEKAGHGSEVAGPVVRRIMDELYRQKPLPIVYGSRSD